jgi:hypothetical protein
VFQRRETRFAEFGSLNEIGCPEDLRKTQSKTDGGEATSKRNLLD